MHFALLLLVLALGAQPLVATTYYVTLQPTLPCTSNTKGISMFFRIQDAVNQVPAGSTINICPGTYAEQVVISQPLTLRGVSYNSSGNSSQVVIAMPGTALTTTSSVTQGTIAAQVQVAAAAVNITGITVDGTASSTDCPTVAQFGIFYSSGSSGTVSEVEIRNQNCNGEGTGILAENAAGPRQTVTIENNNIHDYTFFGIMANNEYSPPTLTASIKNNGLAGPFGIFFSSTTAATVSDNSFTGVGQGVYAGSPSGSVTNNFLNMTGTTPGGQGIGVGAAAVISDNTVNALNNGAGVTGIEVSAPGIISGNTVNNATYGITLDDSAAGAKVTSNRIFNSSADGIDVQIGGATIDGNIIGKSGSAGIELNCNGGLNGGGTVNGNLINGAPIGIDLVPSGLDGTNKIYNARIGTTTGCT
jgi:parallel beta-helix repeat protein